MVEESFPILALTDPAVWYAAEGSPERLEQLLRVMGLATANIYLPALMAQIDVAISAGLGPLKFDLATQLNATIAAQATLAYNQSLVVVAHLFQRPGMDWNGLFRALSESDRTEYTFDNFMIRARARG